MSFSPFRQASFVQFGLVGIGQWPTLKAGLERNIDKLFNYYQYARKPVRNTHPLIKLIHSANIPKNIPLESYVKNVEEIALYAARAVGMSTSVSPGKLFTGVFLSDDQPEILLAYRDFFDPFEAHNNWRNVQAVRLLEAPYTCSFVPFPNGRTFSSEAGLSIFAVNIPLLMVQFRAFYIEQLENYKRDPFSVESIHRFVGGYVLPNLMRDFQDMFFLNRLMASYQGQPNGDSKVTASHVIQTTDYTRFIDSTITRIKEVIPVMHSRAFPALLKNLPAVHYSNMEDALLLPDVMPTKQSAWIEVISRLKAFDFLIELSGSDLKNRNQMAINQFARLMNVYHIKDAWMENLPMELGLHYTALIDKIYEATGIKQEA
jgi:hypothetical protein